MAVGAALVQKQENGRYHPIEFGSQKLNAECRRMLVSHLRTGGTGHGAIPKNVLSLSTCQTVHNLQRPSASENCARKVGYSRTARKMVIINGCISIRDAALAGREEFDCGLSVSKHRKPDGP